MTTQTLLHYAEPNEHIPTASVPEEIEGVRFMRGLVFAVALSLPTWALIIFAIAVV